MKADELLSHLRTNGPVGSGDLVKYFGISRATLMRRIRGLGGQVVQVGRARATKFAALSKDAQDPLPLYRVTDGGQSFLMGELFSLCGGEWFFRSEACPDVLIEGEFKDGLYPGWPWFLEDLRPLGFLGRSFGKRMARLYRFNENPDYWSDLELSTALSAFGHNLVGNYILGDQALDRFHEEKLRIVDGYYKNTSPECYPELAERVLEDGDDFGSSAGGEQPKFATLVCETPEAEPHSVIVKFSPKLGSAIGRRWGDLLRAEYEASETLRVHGIEAAQSRIFEKGDRVFLEVKRFDRVGVFGRLGVVSMRNLDAAVVGSSQQSWADSGQALLAQKMIPEEDLQTITKSYFFGELIGNTDMHFGNLSFFLNEKFPLGLCPIYDMLPMHYRPSGMGEIPHKPFPLRLPKPQNREMWLLALPIALEYWSKLSRDSELSKDFQLIAKSAMAMLEKIRKEVHP